MILAIMNCQWRSIRQCLAIENDLYVVAFACSSCIDTIKAIYGSQSKELDNFNHAIRGKSVEWLSRLGQVSCELLRLCFSSNVFLYWFVINSINKLRIYLFLLQDIYVFTNVNPRAIRMLEKTSAVSNRTKYTPLSYDTKPCIFIHWDSESRM